MTGLPPDNVDPDEPSNGDGEPFVPTGKWASPAIYASNWRSILIVDSLVGVAIFAIGVAMIIWWNWVVGSLVGALGLTYITAVGRRFLQWRWLRQQAGLNT